MIRADALVCLTGGTGYIGGRLLSLLESRGVRVRCLTRRPESLEGHVTNTTQVVRADVLDRGSLIAALADVMAAYYLVHSMGTRGDFEENDRKAATNFAAAAKETECAVKVPPCTTLSPILRITSSRPATTASG